MEEKKTIKISISTLLLIITIIVICIMGYFIYKTNSDKTLLSQNNSNLNNEISSLKVEIENEKDKIKTISNAINSSNNSNTNTELTGTTQVATTNTQHPELTESEALIVATNTYKSAYNMLYSDQVMISGNYNINGEKKYGYKVNINELERAFSKRAIELIKKQLKQYNGEYYDIEEENKTTFFETIDPGSIFSGTDAENRDLTVVDYTDKYIIATGKLLSGENTYGDKVPLYIIFVKENGKWLIEIYE